MKQETIKHESGEVSFIPGEKGYEHKMAYIRIEVKNPSGYPVFCLDNDNLKAVIKVRDWCDKIIKGNAGKK